MAVAMPVLRPKQSDRLAAQLNSPPLTWMVHSLALRKGMWPGSSLWTSAPSETKSSAPSGLIVRLIRFSRRRKSRESRESREHRGFLDFHDSLDSRDLLYLQIS